MNAEDAYRIATDAATEISAATTRSLATAYHHIGETAARGEFSVHAPWHSCSRPVLDRVKRELHQQGYAIGLDDTVSWANPHLIYQH